MVKRDFIRYDFTQCSFLMHFYRSKQEFHSHHSFVPLLSGTL